MTFVGIDASALLAPLLTVRGHDRARAALAESAKTTVNLGEGVAHFARSGAAEAGIHDVLDPPPIERVPFDERLAYMVGLLLPVTRAAGLSFGDRARLALARQRDAPALTTGRSWQRIARVVGAAVLLVR
jgi:ribonuclease VapC